MLQSGPFLSPLFGIIVKFLSSLRIKSLVEGHSGVCHFGVCHLESVILESVILESEVKVRPHHRSHWKIGEDFLRVGKADLSSWIHSLGFNKMTLFVVATPEF